MTIISNLPPIPAITTTDNLLSTVPVSSTDSTSDVSTDSVDNKSDIGTNIALSTGNSAFVENAINNGQAKLQESYASNQSDFSIFKLPDGKTYSKVRDLSTGSVKYYPSITEDSYKYPSVTTSSGNLFETTV